MELTPPAQESIGLSLVVVVEGWRDFHYAGCPRLKGETSIVLLSRAKASATGLTPHKECDVYATPRPATPEVPKATTGSDARPARTPPVAPSTAVYVVPGDRRYHRAECSKMGVGARRVSIELVRPRQVPCPVCKPPARPASK